ncbi:MAG: ABC-F family ATP-binding cassette domain-containing protein [Clostridiales bacterium]|nr:ABC-F family ATP-binding cassette domain-containing protein [Clostridiales bacterium]
MILQIKSAEFRYGDVTIFKNVNLDINEGDSIGLVGANGAGKSTLLGCVTGELQLFDGEVLRKNGLTMGYLKQNCDFVSTNTLFDEMMSVFAYQTQLIEQIKLISEQMSACNFDSSEYKALADKYNRLTVEADVTEAYQSEVKVKTVLNGMGMTEFSDRVVSTLSGGEKTKAALCKLLLQRPELMILDEPTNHLDYKTLDWLETFLTDAKSTLLVVSHDRYFLDKLCTSIWDVQHQAVIAYKGNYSKYKVLKAERQENERRTYDKQQREIEKLTDYIQRNKVRASTADMAKSREKTLNKMDRLDAPKNDERPPRFSFEYTTEPSEFPLTIQRLTLGYDGKQLLRDGQMQIRRGQKVALLGLNGVGKSTLIKRIASCNPQDIGKIVFGKNVRMGYYDQENVNLQSDLRVIDQLWFDNTRMSQTEVRSMLAQVTLGADDVYKLVRDLSGGERAKLGLAMIMAKDCNLLLLDEPTNHLDLPSREALEEALKAYTGTLLYVSHDRYFVNSISNVIAELADCNLTLYEGNYDDFINRKKAPVEPLKPVTKTVQSTYRNAKQRAEEVNRSKKLKELEARITQLEKEVEQLNEQMTLPEITSDYTKLSQVMERLKVVNAELEQTLAEWESLAYN